jgi:recombination protein RecT
MEKEKALVTVNGGALTEKEVVSEAIAFAQTGFGGTPVTLPKGYDISRAVKNFCFALPNVKNIEKATKESIMQAAHDYITQGLDVGKHQCALIVYGDRLTVQREYFGAVNQAMRLNPDVKEISHGAVIHEGEDVAIDYDKFGRLSITHKPDFKCWNKPIAGAYAIVTYYDGSTDAELMTIDEIKTAWAKSRNGNEVHKAFPAEMCKKTVLNRLCKKLINKSDDAAIIDDIDARQTPDFEPVDINAVEEYAEPEFEQISSANAENTEPPTASDVSENEAFETVDTESEDYCITVPYAKYKDEYSDCVVGNYNKWDKTIEVYPNRKKETKGGKE